MESWSASTLDPAYSAGASQQLSPAGDDLDLLCMLLSMMTALADTCDSQQLSFASTCLLVIMRHDERAAGVTCDAVDVVVSWLSICSWMPCTSMSLKQCGPGIRIQWLRQEHDCAGSSSPCHAGFMRSCQLAFPRLQSSEGNATAPRRAAVPAHKVASICVLPPARQKHGMTCRLPLAVALRADFCSAACPQLQNSPSQQSLDNARVPRVR